MDTTQRWKGKNKDTVIGWDTNELNGSKMQIIFSMSSQLWITVHITEELQKYKVATCKITQGRKYNYSQLYDMLTAPPPPPPPPSPESSTNEALFADELAASLSQINLT